MTRLRRINYHRHRLCEAILYQKPRKSCLTITQRLNRRFPATYITDNDFADDIALLSNSIEDAQCLLSLVIKTAKEVGLSLNVDKIEYMSYSTPSPRNDTILASENPLKKVNDCKKLGTRVENSEKDMKARKAQAWGAIRKLDNI